MPDPNEATPGVPGSPAIPAPPDLPGQGAVEVTGGRQGFRQEIRVRGHLLIADEPTTVPGGTDAGPDPYAYLLAALGACTSMTLRMYADLKKLPLEGVRVRLQHRKIYAADCADCGAKTSKIARIERVIELSGPLDDAQRQRLLEIADRCPVHRTLTSEIRIETRLAALTP